VLGMHHGEISPTHQDAVIAAHPRTNFKAGIVEAFYEGMKDKPETAFGTMNTDILEAKDPNYHRPDFCYFIANSAFPD
jgi:hypothetical protein